MKRRSFPVFLFVTLFTLTVSWHSQAAGPTIPPINFPSPPQIGPQLPQPQIPPLNFPNVANQTTATPPSVAVFEVNDTSDKADPSPTDGKCDVGGGKCTLRAAIQTANNIPPNPDVLVDIHLKAGTYTFVIAPSTTQNDASSGDLDITRSLSIGGDGADNTTVDGNQLDRIFHIQPGIKVLITKMTLQNGNKQPDPGGCIFNDSSALKLTDMVIKGCKAGAGGAINNSGGTLEMTNVTLDTNEASFIGGGIHNIAGTATLTNVTFSGNKAAQRGGGLNNVNGSTATLTNVTFSENSAPQNGGGGIANGNPINAQDTSTTNLKNALVAKNPGGDCVKRGAGAIATQGHNLDSDGSCFAPGGTDLSNPDPKLATELSGTPVKVLALLAGSPAIDAGDNNGCPQKDPLGTTRPQGAACDIGAFEFVVAAAGTPVCGNGIVESGEECDDGNAIANDGCTNCRIDSGFSCTGSPSTCAQTVVPPPTGGGGGGCQLGGMSANEFAPTALLPILGMAGMWVRRKRM
jgi:CSLREA domain-containing protein